MNYLRYSCRATALAMAAVMTIVTMPVGSARAGLVTTDELIAGRRAEGDRDHVRQFILRDDVAGQMRQLGVDPAEAAARVDGMTDEEVREIAGRIDLVPAGQDALGAIVGAAVLIFVVLLITDIAGFTKVFPFTRSVGR
jgi:hypothetical protein